MRETNLNEVVWAICYA